MNRRAWIVSVVALLSGFRSVAGSNMLGQMTQNEGMFAVPAPVGGVVVDGDLREWDLSGEIWSFADYDLRDTFSVKSAAMWDEEALYLSFRWKDPMPLNSTVDPAFNASIGWRADAVECRMKVGEKPLWLTSWSYEGRPCMTLSYWGSESKSSDGEWKVLSGEKGSVSLGEGIESAYVMVPTKDGFVHEMKLPWSMFEACGLKAGTVPERFLCGLEFKWGAANGSGQPLHKYTDNMRPGSTSREFFWTSTRSWGDVVLLDRSVEKKREYVYEIAKPQGTIPVRVTVPAEAKSFTIVIEDAEGCRVRNLAGGFDCELYRVGEASDGVQTVEVMWDGCDDVGVLVTPGEYGVRGLTHTGLTPRYVMSLYNPGTPAWSTPDGKGAWGSDHMRVRCVAASGEGVVLASGFVEGGYGVWRMGADDTKAWSELRGVQAMSANDRYVFTIPNHWGTKEECLYRYHAADGSYAPFVQDGEEKPLEWPVREILGVEELACAKSIESEASVENKMANPKVMGLVAGPKSVLVLLAEGKVAEIDQETGTKLGEYNLEYAWADLTEDHPFVPMAYDGKTIFFFRKGALMRYEVATGAVREIATSVAVEKPSAMALDREGALYVADCGSDMQVKKFSPEGALLGTFGRKGGRARVGKFEEGAMRDMSAVAVDARSRVWVVEYSDTPRRVSVWNADGSFARDFVGNTTYAGSGVVLHDSDPGRVFVGANELSFDESAHTYKMESVLVNPEPGALTLDLHLGNALGHVFYSSASGQKREYFYHDQNLFMNDGKGSWRAVACVKEVGKIQHLFSDGHHNLPLREPYGEFEGLHPWDLVYWHDENGDGFIQRAECEIKPMEVEYKLNERVRNYPRWMTSWSSRLDPEDLSLYVMQRLAKPRQERWRMKPASFTADGVPRWSIATSQILTNEIEGGDFDTLPVPNEDTVLTFASKKSKGVLMALTKDGKEKWTYPSPYTHVHGSHKAVMPRPGLLIGCLKVLGFVPDCGDAGCVFGIRGNLGEDYYLTTDGLFVSSMFRDCRLPSQVPPETEEELRKMPFGIFSMGGEPFSGCLMRQDDGVVRMLCGTPAREAANLVILEGFESIRRFTAPLLPVNEEMLRVAESANTLRMAEQESGKPYGIARVRGEDPAALDWKSIAPMRIAVEGQRVTGECRLAVSDTTLFAQWVIAGDESPWSNTGSDKARMFKTGDCVDLCLSPSANSAREAKEGDLRIVVSPFGTGSIAMLLRKVCAAAEPTERVQYMSPVRSFDMAQVKEVGAPTVTRSEGTVTVTLALPLAELGLDVKSGSKFRGDAGMILSDPSGMYNIARIYYSNKNTNLVNDLPGEADLCPNEWCEFFVK